MVSLSINLDKVDINKIGLEYAVRFSGGLELTLGLCIGPTFYQLFPPAFHIPRSDSWRLLSDNYKPVIGIIQTIIQKLLKYCKVYAKTKSKGTTIETAQRKAFVMEQGEQHSKHWKSVVDFKTTYTLI